MEYRRLNVTVVSAEGIKDVKLLSKMDVYADVSLAGYPQSRKVTPVDKNSGTNPKWNFPVDFVVDEPYLTRPGLSLLFRLMAESTLKSDKLIGTVTVPIDDLFRSATADADRTVVYPVVTASGKPKGSLKFSYRFGEKFTHQAPATAKHGGDEPVTAYPAPAPAGYPPAAAYPQTSGYQYGYHPHGYQPAAAGYNYKPQKPKKSGMGGGLGLGLGAGLLGGLLVGEMASDIGDAAAYADGYGDAMDDMGDFDF
ncbi:protein SRC2 homolog [Andrographis paniculata]|uniref:protein SRC2 homolog n=1 Tax=Andrographis paniculata TaxID=175694 RepID=UPI0021E8852B|nr:protein SRC2 homolog [Andrographis paniculata]